MNILNLTRTYSLQQKQKMAKYMYAQKEEWPSGLNTSKRVLSGFQKKPRDSRPFGFKNLSKINNLEEWPSGRVVEGTSLEKMHLRNGIVSTSRTKLKV